MAWRGALGKEGRFQRRGRYAASGRHEFVVLIGVDRGEEDKVTSEEDVGCLVMCKSMEERPMLGELPERVDRCFYKFRPDPPFP